MSKQEIALIAHLMRRAGFGATRDELEGYASRGYEQVVEDLLYPERFPEVEEDVLLRYHIDMNDQDGLRSQGRWIYRMINTEAPLREKLALFWHRVFATGAGKSMHYPSSGIQIETFRGQRLLQLPRYPAGHSPGPGHDLLAGQQREPRGPAQRELGARAAGALLHGRGQLHRTGREDGGPRLHRMDVHPAPSGLPLRELQQQLRLP